MRVEKHFNSLSGFWKYTIQESNARRKDSRDPSEAWSGNVSWEEACALAKRGWKEGLKEVERFRARIVPAITQKVLRPQQVNAIAGYNVDIGTFLANDPECFISRVYEERNYPGKIYKIVCSIAVSASISPEVIIQRGAMICALVDAIEYAGHRVEVICNSSLDNRSGYGYGKNNDRFEISVVAKRSEEALSMSELAFCLAHPAMLRKMVFSAAEIERWSDHAPGYGIPSDASDKGDIYVKEIYSKEVSDEKAIEWVLQKLKELDIDIEENRKM